MPSSPPQRISLFSLLLFILCLVSACTTAPVLPAAAASPSGDPSTGPSARWITSPDQRVQSPANSWLAFEKTIDLGKVPPTALAEIAADSKYWLWVNDSLVVREGGLKWGPSPTEYYADQVDLSPYLTAGSNRIAVVVWYFGKPGFSHYDSGRSGLWLSAPDVGLATDASWRAAPHPAFLRRSPDPQPNYRLPESNIHFAADRLGDFTSADAPLFGFTGPWRPAFPFSRTATAVPRPIPQWKDFGLRNYANSPTLPYTSTGDTLRLQLPYNAQVTARLTVTAPAGEAPPIDIRTDHYRGGGPPNVRTIFRPRPGIRQTFESPGWFNGHHVEYAIPAGYTVHALSFRETGYASEFTGRFECNDPFYNRLWTKAQRTLYVTMRDSYMDCPDRERAQWWGDVVLEAGETHYALDRTSDRLTRKAIRELLDWQRPDSTIYSPVPAGNWDGELPTQMLASVGRYGIWNYYWQTGDRALIEAVYPAVARYLSVWQTDAEGLVVPRQGDWTWGDWGDNKDMPLLFNGWYALALDGQARMAELIGRADEARTARNTLDRLRQAFNATFWQGDHYRSPGYGGATDDRGHALAVLAGIAPPTYYSAIRQVFADQRHASPYFEKYVEEALFVMDFPADALERMKDRFSPMVDSELTTLWEGWEIGSVKYGGGTANHAWSGGGLTLLSQFVAGIAPTTAGYRSVRIRPQLGGLTAVEAAVDTPLGLLTVRIDGSGDEPEVRYDAPPGMTITVER